MPLDTGAFVAGVGVLIALDTLSIALTFEAYRNGMADEQARERAAEAEETAQYAASRMTQHLNTYHDEDGQTARQRFEADERRAE